MPKQNPRANRRARLRRRKREAARLDRREEERSRNSWLCSCGSWIETGLHCECCGAEPPFGCPCEWCEERGRERYEDEEPDYDPISEAMMEERLEALP